jgi:hypothetical protein
LKNQLGTTKAADTAAFFFAENENFPVFTEGSYRTLEQVVAQLFNCTAHLPKRAKERRHWSNALRGLINFITGNAPCDIAMMDC